MIYDQKVKSDFFTFWIKNVLNSQKESNEREKINKLNQEKKQNKEDEEKEDEKGKESRIDKFLMWKIRKSIKCVSEESNVLKCIQI